MVGRECSHLGELLAAERVVLLRHVEEHAYFMGEREHRGVELGEAANDYIEKYAWIMREFYCGFVCPDRFGCEIAREFLPRGVYKKNGGGGG